MRKGKAEAAAAAAVFPMAVDAARRWPASPLAADPSQRPPSSPLSAAMARRRRRHQLLRCLHLVRQNRLPIDGTRGNAGFHSHGRGCSMTMPPSCWDDSGDCSSPMSPAFRRQPSFDPAWCCCSVFFFFLTESCCSVCTRKTGAALPRLPLSASPGFTNIDDARI